MDNALDNQGLSPKPQARGVVLALDYGDQRIGLAVTDRERAHALAHSVIPAVPRVEALRTIHGVIAAEQVQEIVLGLPLTLEGLEGEQAQKVRAFGAALQKETRLPVAYVDERFTTRGGEENARMKGVTSSDAEAARLILQTWLDKNAKSG